MTPVLSARERRLALLAALVAVTLWASAFVGIRAAVGAPRQPARDPHQQLPVGQVSRPVRPGQPGSSGLRQTCLIHIPSLSGHPGTHILKADNSPRDGSMTP